MKRSLITEAEAADLCGWSAYYLRDRRRRQTRALVAGVTDGPEVDLAPRPVGLPATSSKYSRPRIRYDRREVERWLREHPEVGRRDALLEQLLTTEEAADLIGVPARTLRDWRTVRRKLEALGDERGADEAGPPFRMISKWVRYDRKEVQRWSKRRAAACRS